MTIERQHTNERSSQLVLHGNTVYLAGQVARDRPWAGIAEQTANTLARIDALLAEAGSDKTRLLNVTIWLADIRDFPAMNQVWVDWLPRGCGPARAVIEGRLAYPEFNVEIAVTAAR
ncbi:MAG: RidA family protein [Alphaproteobacteria bacterium]|nr:RidA family protein [Alphaproteobacteria bacterium]